MAKNEIAILYDEELKEYDFGPGHPFRGNRYEIFYRFLEKNMPKGAGFSVLKAVKAKDEDLSLICRQEYIDFVKDYYNRRNSELPFAYTSKIWRYLSGDNIPFGRPGKVEEAARLIVGQAKMAADLVQKGEFKKAVSIGGGMHHAKPSYGEGFCVYNDVAFAAKYLIKKYKLERILILDTDAHAGNGTAEYFNSDPRVLFVDLHQDPKTLYPGIGYADEIGFGRGKGFTINCPLPPGARWDSYRYFFEEIIFPVVEEFQPQIIVRNGGSDPYWLDKLTNLGLTIADFKKIGEKVRELAEICDGKEIDMIGSGYYEQAIGPAWLALISGLGNIKIPICESESNGKKQRNFEDKVVKGTAAELKKRLKIYWKSFK